MDERDLKAMLHEAPGDVPPPTFGVGDIAAASRRATARQRMRIAGAASIVAVVLVGGGVVLSGVLSGGDSGEPSAIGARQADEDVSGDHDEQQEPHAAEDTAEDSAEEERAPAEGESLDDSGPDGCEAIDRELATLLADALPAEPTSGPMPGVEPWCAGVERGASYEVRDGNATGVISVVVVPAELGGDAKANEYPVVEAIAANGDYVYVASIPDGESGAAPFEGDLQRLADTIADDL